MNPKSSIAEGALRSFWSGLATPSLPTALGAVAFALLELYAAALWVTPKKLARIDPVVLMEGRNDDRSVVTVEALRMRRPSKRRGVAMLGASHGVRSLVDHGAGIPDRLLRATGEHVDFFPLCAAGQSIAEWIVLLDQIPPDFRGVVILTVIDQMGTIRGRQPTRVHTRMALSSPTFDHPPEIFARHLQPTDLASSSLLPPTGVYFLDHLAFFASRRSALVRAGPAERRPPAPRVARKTRRNRQSFATILAKMEREPGPALIGILPELAALIAPLRRPGLEIVILEAPVNPRLDAMKRASHSRADVYDPAMLAFARREGVRYWNPSAEVEISDADFTDAIHLHSASGRRRFEAAIAGRLGALLRGEEVADGPRSPPVDPAALATEPEAAAADSEAGADEDAEPHDLE
jgi:hypothetical protein